MKNMKKLTVIVPTYNAEKNIQKCIQSIMQQTYNNLEIIIIDDCSKDATYDVCLELIKNDKRIKLYSNEINKGVSYSRNKGIEYATGYYITFVDADDYIEDNTYEILINNMEKNDVQIAMCNFFMEYENKDIKILKKCMEIMEQEEMLEKVFLSDFFGGFVWNKVFIKDIIQNSEIRFNEDIHICEDLLFVYEYMSKIKKGYYTNEKLYHYIQYTNSSYNKEYNKKWNSVIDAYENIKLISKQKNEENFRYSYVYSLLNLKEKIYMCNNYKNKKILAIINEKLKENYKGIYTFKNITLTTKIKIFLKRYMMRLFIILKYKER